MRVLAADPGKATGWSCWYDSWEYPATGEDDFQDFLSRTELWLKSPWPGRTVVVAERYVIGPETLKKTRQTWSLEIIGVLRYFAGKYGAEYEPQMAADAKAFSTNEKLRRIGWWTRGRDHANDATRHLLLYLAKQNLLPPGLISL